jgi:hypothetical protein
MSSSITGDPHGSVCTNFQTFMGMKWVCCAVGWGHHQVKILESLGPSVESEAQF